jgi:predicted CXXCH cytochrome family protein
MPRNAFQGALALLGALLVITMTHTLADVRTSPHNLTGSGGALDNQLCIFCHAPAVRQGDVSAPLWRSDLDQNYQFPVYDDTGVGALSGGRVGSHSVVCLSCHDALQAPNAGPTVAPGISPDHPIGVAYRGNVGFMPPLAEYKAASSATINGRLVWWISPRGPSGARSRDDLPFFSGVTQQSPEPVPLIECGTCHDPHSTNRLFLRGASSQQSICLTCHVK